MAKAIRRCLRLILVWTIIASLMFDVALACRGRRRAHRDETMMVPVFAEGAHQKSALQKSALQKSAWQKGSAVQKGDWQSMDPVPPAPGEISPSDRERAVPPAPPERAENTRPNDSVPGNAQPPVMPLESDPAPPLELAPAEQPRVAPEAPLDPPVAETPVPRQEPVTPQPEPAVDPLDDLFGDSAPQPLAPPTEQPALPEAPAGEDPAPAADPLKDLFGDMPAEEISPAQPESPAADQPASDPLQDLFADPPAEDAAPADAPSQPPAELFQDLFNGDASPGDQPSEAVPADQAPEPAEELFKDLFGDPEPVEQSSGDPADPFGAVTPNQDPLALRHWVDDTGHFEVNARLIAILDGHVRLLKENGRTCTVPLQRLSPTDLILVQQARAQYGTGLIAQLAGQ